MVGCSHLGRAVRVTSRDMRKLKPYGRKYSAKYRRNRSSNEDGAPENPPAWSCSKCGTSDCPWICLTCAKINCGRYANGDGLHHFKKHNTHALVMHCLNYTVYCYKCDNNVAGDTMDRRICNVRQTLHYHNKKALVPTSEDSGDGETEDEDSIARTSSLSSLSSSEGEGDSVLEDAPLASSLVLDTPPDEHLIRPDSPTEYRLLRADLPDGPLLRLRKRRLSPITRDTNEEEQIWRGLRNLGNSCFMNSVLQALNSVTVFRDFFNSLPMLVYEKVESRDHPAAPPRYNTRKYRQMSADYSSSDSDSSMLAEELRKTVVALSSSKTSACTFSPDALRYAVGKMNERFAGYDQQDGHDFLRCVLDQLHADLRRCRIPDDCAWKVASECGADYLPSSSAISLMFEGALQSQVTCLACGMTSNKQDPFLDLSLDLHVPHSANGRSVNVNLTECIQRFFEKEELQQCEQYICGKCNDRKASTKQLFLRCLPKILCLHLKRFRWTHTSQGKVDNIVDFPLHGLDFSSYLSPSCKNGKRCVYNLSSIVVHHGSRMGGGHYTAYCYRDGHWAHYNDSSVKVIDIATVLKQKAYILFYSRVR